VRRFISARRVLKRYPDGREEYGPITRFWYDDERFPFSIMSDEPPPRKTPDETDEAHRRRYDEWKARRPIITNKEDYKRDLERRGYRIVGEG